MTYFFTSDTHFGHANIIKYCNRPFKSLEQMNETLIRNWNQRVKPNDTVIVIGDFCFKNTVGGKLGEGALSKSDYYISQLNGHKVFIKGSHDNNNSLNTKITSLVIDMSGYEMCCVHDPRDAHGDFKINLVGHVHKAWKIRKMASGSIMINVGVDVWKYMPVTIQEILGRMEQFKKGAGEYKDEWYK